MFQNITTISPKNVSLMWSVFLLISQVKMYAAWLRENSSRAECNLWKELLVLYSLFFYMFSKATINLHFYPLSLWSQTAQRNNAPTSSILAGKLLNDKEHIIVTSQRSSAYLYGGQTAPGNIDTNSMAARLGEEMSTRTCHQEIGQKILKGWKVLCYILNQTRSVYTTVWMKLIGR